MLRAIRLFSPLILMKPQRVYWLGFVLLLASGGLSQSQQDARDVPTSLARGKNSRTEGRSPSGSPTIMLEVEWTTPQPG